MSIFLDSHGPAPWRAVVFHRAVALSNAACAAIELRLIRHAIAVGQHGNFARAAEALHLTQPSLSRSIASLEDQLGVPLFDRTPKGVTPTPFGRVLLERGETVLRREADLRREIALLAGLETGSLVISAAPYMDEVLIARAIGRMAAATSVGSMSSCAPMSLITVPGLMTPGHLISVGTR
jgi:hypothetical protein